MEIKQIANWYAQCGCTKNAHMHAQTQSPWFYDRWHNGQSSYSWVLRIQAIFIDLYFLKFLYWTCILFAISKKSYLLFHISSQILFFKTLVLECNLYSKAWDEVSKNLRLSGLKYLHNVLNKTQLHFSIWKYLPTNISNKILSDLGDTIKPIKLLAITIPDSGLWKYPQMFLFSLGRASIKKALCSARLGSTNTKKTLFSAQIGDYLCRPIRVGVRSAISRLSFSILNRILLSVKT